jgi:hypothetical protein
MRQYANVPTLRLPLSTLCDIMAKTKPPLARSEETLEELLDIVANAREELVAVERRLEQLRADIETSQKRKDGSRKK